MTKTLRRPNSHYVFQLTHFIMTHPSIITNHHQPLPHSLTHPLTHSPLILTQPYNHSLTQSLPLSIPPSLTPFRPPFLPPSLHASLPHPSLPHPSLPLSSAGGIQALLRLGRTRSTDEQLQHKAALTVGQLATNAVKLMPKGGVTGGVEGKNKDAIGHGARMMR